MTTYVDPQWRNIRIFDNEGRTMDRYTVVINRQVFTMSSDACSPGGVNMFARELDEEETMDDLSYLGKKRTYLQVPTEVRKAIIERMNGRA